MREQEVPVVLLSKRNVDVYECVCFYCHLCCVFVILTSEVYFGVLDDVGTCEKVKILEILSNSFHAITKLDQKNKRKYCFKEAFFLSSLGIYVSRFVSRV